MSRQPLVPGDAWAGVSAGLAHAGRLRDAGWLPLVPGRAEAALALRSQVLHRWSLGAEGRATGLVFQPLDGNPRHGVLALYLAGCSEPQGAIEILERQGRWLVMPDGLRARALAAAAVMPGTTARTPDRRYVFFNTLQDGRVLTRVERRPDGDTALT